MYYAVIVYHGVPCDRSEVVEFASKEEAETYVDEREKAWRYMVKKSGVLQGNLTELE